uniref:Uncharacterized protein n=1 Tax=Myoviridae sp. ctOoC8 TaxID=2823542 RepID=A0A8S5L6C8_9CAUD|nr:MAG TPA: hypothetical protein [Myoviridae sp. ctOoC8]DAY26224.1 MAG TPA: hypothetical protein [Caudoviricetes sp.]
MGGFFILILAKNRLDLYLFAWYFCSMPRNRENYLKRARYIVEVYKKHKYDDVPDTRIVRHIFPKYHIYINYRQWMNIKGMVIPRETSQQLSLF